MSSNVNNNNTNATAAQEAQRRLMQQQQEQARRAQEASQRAREEQKAKEAEQQAAEEQTATNETQQRQQQQQSDAATRAQGEAARAEAEATQINRNGNPDDPNAPAATNPDGTPVDPNDPNAPAATNPDGTPADPNDPNAADPANEQTTIDRIRELLGDQVKPGDELTKEQIAKLKEGLTPEQQAEIDNLIEDGKGPTLKEITEAFPDQPPRPRGDGNNDNNSGGNNGTANPHKSNTDQMMNESTEVKSNGSGSSSGGGGSQGNVRETRRQTQQYKLDFSDSTASVQAETDISRLAGLTTQNVNSASTIAEVSSTLTSVTNSNNESVIATRASVEANINTAASSIDNAIDSALGGSEANITDATDRMQSALSRASTAEAYNDLQVMSGAIYEAQTAGDDAKMAAESAKESATLAAQDAQGIVIGLAANGADKIKAVETAAIESENGQQQNGFGQGVNRFVNNVFNSIASGFVGEGTSPAQLNAMGVNQNNTGAQGGQNALDSAIFGGTGPVNPAASGNNIQLAGTPIGGGTAGASPTISGGPETVRRGLLA